MEESLKGRLLVATPGLVDPNFDRTVVLMMEHSDEGAIGLVLNRPGPLPVESPFPEWAELAAPPAAIFYGGPVVAGTVVTLARSTDPDMHPEHWIPLFGDIGVVNVRLDPEESGPGLDEVRVFSGYAGWAAGQLEGEIAGGGWFVVDADAEDAFTPAPEELWGAVLRRQRGRLRIFAACPPDPSAN
ncbi:MAG: YqgE/AlgH family protein [Acidimicrobiia bacterium]|nr:YqgE/AlgH family protein [Acidimicrobiia bacterium]